MSVVLKAEKREELGSTATKRVRRANRIPAVIYCEKENINLSVDVKEFEHEYHKGTTPTTVIELELDGKKIKAIVHEIELDPVSDRPVHIDFFNCDEAKVIRAKPKVTFINKDKSPGLKRGAFLHVVVRRTEVLCDDEKSIPDELTVNVGSLHVGSKIRANDITLPAGVKFAKKGNFLLGSLIGRGKSEEETPAAEGEAAPAEAEAKTEEADKK